MAAAKRTIIRNVRQRDEGWTIDRHIPLSILFAFAFQTFGAAWWAAGMTTRIDALEKLTATVAPAETRITRLEEKLGSIKDGLDEIKALLRSAKP